jgi:hypothetical protein
MLRCIRTNTVFRYLGSSKTDEVFFVNAKNDPTID